MKTLTPLFTKTPISMFFYEYLGQYLTNNAKANLKSGRSRGRP